jgi:hypothetical protein
MCGNHILFDDGEKIYSKYEQMFSLYLRDLGLIYNKDYFRDVKYNTFSDINLKSGINCDYQINYGGRTFYVELAGMIHNKHNEECFKNNTVIQNSITEAYRVVLTQKRELFEKYNLEYHILLASQLNKTTYNKIFSINQKEAI